MRTAHASNSTNASGTDVIRPDNRQFENINWDLRNSKKYCLNLNQVKKAVEIRCEGEFEVAVVPNNEVVIPENVRKYSKRYVGLAESIPLPKSMSKGYTLIVMATNPKTESAELLEFLSISKDCR